MLARIALVAVFVSSPAAGPAALATRIRFAPAEGLALRKSFEKRTEQELDWITVTMGGEEEDQDQGQRSGSTSRLVVVDRYVAVAEERVAELERRYEDFEGRQRTEVSVGGEERTIESESGCELVGRSVSFAWDAEDEAPAAACEDDEVEAEWLEELGWDLDFLALLPDGEVEVGDQWEVDAAAFRRVVRFEQGLPLVTGHDGDDGPEESPEEDAELPEPEESVRGELTARFAETREEGGVALAVIELSGAYVVSAEAEQVVEDEAGTQTSRMRQSTRVELEGEFLWAVDAGHLARGSFEAESETRTSADMRFEIMGQVIDVEQESSASGTVGFSARFEPAG